jgi:peroxiredoxin Q/BCP
MLDIHTKAPAFSLLDENEHAHSLEDYAGQWLVLYFYPKDDTPGCTEEACVITQVYDDFKELGVSVIGVSKDSSASHKKFKEKYSLPFTLLSDESTQMIQAYDALAEKSMFGKRYAGINRITYIINPAGEIEKVYPKVSPAEHALELLKDLKVLTAK